jgi:hypothetical protein
LDEVATAPVVTSFKLFLPWIKAASIEGSGNFEWLANRIGKAGLIAVPIVFLSSCIANYWGTYFDLANDRLSCPYEFWRLGVPLSAIQDANCETESLRALDILNSLGKKVPAHKTVKHYKVNLSGDFGSRRLRFRSKTKRDEFLACYDASHPTYKSLAGSERSGWPGASIQTGRGTR